MGQRVQKLGAKEYKGRRQRVQILEAEGAKGAKAGGKRVVRGAKGAKTGDKDEIS